MTTTSTQIEEKLKHKKGFLGCFPSDELPNPALHEWSIIMNYDPDYKPGSHWVAIKATKHELYYFDSFGFPPDYDDPILKDKTHFHQWMLDKSYGRRLVSNNYDYQKLGADTCGEWATMFIVRPQHLKEAKNMIDKDRYVKYWFDHFTSAEGAY